MKRKAKQQQKWYKYQKTKGFQELQDDFEGLLDQHFNSLRLCVFTQK